MSARDNILKRLRASPTPFTDHPPVPERRVMVPMEGVPLTEEFVKQAHALAIRIAQPQNAEEALDEIMKLIGQDKNVLAWDFDQIPLKGLDAALKSAGVEVADPRNGGVRVGITGVDAALAATGSIVVSARPGRPRSVSLLPYVHIAVIRPDQIVPHFDAWIAGLNRDEFRKVGNHVVITGASRTADIAMELVHGAHGPAQLHFVIYESG